MSDRETPIVERAYELARTGRFHKIYDLMRALKDEGYGNVGSQIVGPMLKKSLTEEGRVARGERNSRKPKSPLVG